jgi:hypothetical protein
MAFILLCQDFLIIAKWLTRLTWKLVVWKFMDSRVTENWGRKTSSSMTWGSGTELKSSNSGKGNFLSAWEHLPLSWFSMRKSFLWKILDELLKLIFVLLILIKNPIPLNPGIAHQKQSRMSPNLAPQSATEKCLFGWFYTKTLHEKLIYGE